MTNQSNNGHCTCTNNALFFENSTKVIYRKAYLLHKGKRATLFLFLSITCNISREFRVHFSHSSAVLVLNEHWLWNQFLASWSQYKTLRGSAGEFHSARPESTKYRYERVSCPPPFFSRSANLKTTLRSHKRFTIVGKIAS